jgi:hypothetical protein
MAEAKQVPVAAVLGVGPGLGASGSQRLDDGTRGPPVQREVLKSWPSAQRTGESASL